MANYIVYMRLQIYMNVKILMVLYHRRGCKIHFSEILKVNVFSRPLVEQHYMYISISIENISFSRNCDIITTKCEKCHGRFRLSKVYS